MDLATEIDAPGETGGQNKTTTDEENKDNSNASNVFSGKTRTNQNAPGSDGFGSKTGQHTNQNQEGLDGKVAGVQPGQTTVQPGQTMSRADVQKMAEQKVFTEQYQKLFEKYGLKEDIDNLQRQEMTIEELASEANKLSYQFMNPKNVAEMKPAERKQYENNIARTIKLYDTVKKYTGFNLYTRSFNKKIKNAEKIKDKLEGNLEQFVGELKGALFTNPGVTEFHKDILASLPDYIKNDQRYSNVIQHLARNPADTQQGGGLRTLRRELDEKASVQEDLDELIGASIGEYQTKIGTVKKQLQELTSAIAQKPGDKALIKQRMNKNAEFLQYQREIEKLEDSQDQILDDLLEIQTEYAIVDEDCQIKEAVISSTQYTLRELKAGIKRMKQYAQQNENVAVIGGHMTDLRYARQVAEMINLGGLVAGKATLTIMQKMNDGLRNQPSFANAGYDKSTALNNDMKELKRQQVEEHKKIRNQRRLAC